MIDALKRRGIRSGDPREDRIDRRCVFQCQQDRTWILDHVEGAREQGQKGDLPLEQ